MSKQRTNRRPWVILRQMASFIKFHLSSLVYCGGILGHYTFDFLTPEVSPGGCNSGARDGKSAFFRGSEPHYVTDYFFKLRKAVESPRNSFLSVKYDN